MLEYIWCPRVLSSKIKLVSKLLGLLLFSLSTSASGADQALWARSVSISSNGVWAVFDEISENDARAWREDLARLFGHQSSVTKSDRTYSASRVRLDDVLPSWLIRWLGRKSPTETNCKATAFAMIGLAPDPWSFESTFGIGAEHFVFQNAWTQSGVIDTMVPDRKTLVIGDLLYYPMPHAGETGSDHIVTYLGHGVVAEHNPKDFPQTYLLSVLTGDLDISHDQDVAIAAGRVDQIQRLYGPPSLLVRKTRDIPFATSFKKWRQSQNTSTVAAFDAANSGLSRLFNYGSPISPLPAGLRATAESLRRNCKASWLKVKSQESTYVEGESEFWLSCFKTMQRFKLVGGYKSTGARW